MKNSLNNQLFITDGGLETVLIYEHSIDLPYFAAFPLLTTPKGIETLKCYYRKYLDIAVNHQIGYVFETPTWRASSKWAYQLGYTEDELDLINLKAVTLAKRLKDEYKSKQINTIISGQVGPRDDGYVVKNKMSIEEAQNYHFKQIQTLTSGGVDHISAFTINYIEEAIGIINSAKSLNIPVIISFTVETDGKLPDGSSLESAITMCDTSTDSYVNYYMINCAHPKHLNLYHSNGKWLKRIQGLRANASTKSHEELDNCTHLDTGDINVLANDYKILQKKLTNLNVFGGCCGTIHTHIQRICETVL